MRPDRQLSRSKRPTEEFRLSWDFVNDIEATDSYSAHTITASVVSTGVDVTATFLQSPTRVGATGAILGVQVQGGTDGLDYDVSFQLTTTQGDTFQRVVRVSVRA
jgi:hypothetical protein